MASLNNITNLIKCGLSGISGFATAHCKFNWNDMSGGAILLLRKNTELPEDITLASLKELIKTGKAVFLKTIYSFEVATSENQEETSSGGQIAVATKGLYAFSFKFINGLFYDNALATLNSYNAWDVVFVDSSGNVLYQNNNGKRKGFTSGMVDATPIDFGAGAVTTKTGVRMQLINRREMDLNKVGIDANALDFSVLELEDVNQLEVSLNAVSDGDLAITGKIVSKWDSSLTSTEIDIADLTVTGATASAATVAENGTLNIVVSAVSTDDVITVGLNGVFEDTEGVLFKSNTSQVVVTA